MLRKARRIAASVCRCLVDEVVVARRRPDEAAEVDHFSPSFAKLNRRFFQVRGWVRKVRLASERLFRLSANIDPGGSLICEEGTPRIRQR